MADQQYKYLFTTVVAIPRTFCCIVAVCCVVPKDQEKDSSYTRTEQTAMSDELYRHFHVLGVLLLLSPLIHDLCGIIIDTYNRLRAESRGANSNIATSVGDRVEAPADEVVDERELRLKTHIRG